MICPHCDTALADNEKFCPRCGEPVSINTSTTPSSSQTAAGTDGGLKNNNAARSSNSSKRKAPSQNQAGGPPRQESSARRIQLKYFRMAGIGAAAVLVVVVIICLVIFLAPDPGRRTAESLADKLGRTAALAEKDTGITLADGTSYPVLRQIVSYDYLVESDKIITVEGIQLPEWVVFVQMDSSDKISSVTYYDFSLLQHTWKGNHRGEDIDESKLTYGMARKEAEKIVGFSPLVTTWSNDDTILCRYKYYFLDDMTRNEKACYLNITYDLVGNVKLTNIEENNYIPMIFG